MYEDISKEQFTRLANQALPEKVLVKNRVFKIQTDTLLSGGYRIGYYQFNGRHFVYHNDFSRLCDTVQNDALIAILEIHTQLDKTGYDIMYYEQDYKLFIKSKKNWLEETNKRFSQIDRYIKESKFSYKDYLIHMGHSEHIIKDDNIKNIRVIPEVPKEQIEEVFKL